MGGPNESNRPAAREGWIDDRLFEALSDRHRRYALYFLLEHGSVSVEELADVVVGWLYATEPGMVSRAQRDRIHIDLVHRHLPVLEAAEMVSIDEGTVSMDDCPDRASWFVRLSLEAETADAS